MANLNHAAAVRAADHTAPEFFDKSLFRGFIHKLRESGVVKTDANGKLDFGEAKDAKVILGRELRHTILKITPESARGTAGPAAQPQDGA